MPPANVRRAKSVIAPAAVFVRGELAWDSVVTACVMWFEMNWMPVAASSDIVRRTGEAAQPVALQSPLPLQQALAQLPPPLM